MSFDKSRVYTALNADELKVGSKVIVSNNLNDLIYLANNVFAGLTLRDIKSGSNQNRFEVINEHKEVSCWNLAYLISEPEEKKLKWTDLKIGDILREKNGTQTCMVTIIDTSNEIDCEGDILHICLGDWWATDNDLEDWEKVEE